MKAISIHIYIDRERERELNPSLYTCSAAAAAKSLQSCPTLCNPIDGSPPGSPIPGILKARTIEWIAISFSDCIPETDTIL